jgi:cytidine deaminase
MAIDIDPLLLHLHESAKEAREHAYAPYSHYRVGAALLTADGEQFLGANVENASYSVTMCAERVALGSAVAAGHRDFEAIAIAVDGSNGPPCGSCRQALAEFAPDLRVVFSNEGRLIEMSLRELLPAQFDTEALVEPSSSAVPIS